jgi:hypothetical protein
VAGCDDKALVELDALEVKSLLVYIEPHLNVIEGEECLLGSLDDPLFLLLQVLCCGP